MDSTKINLPRLDLLLKHLNAARVLDEYVHNGALEKDIQSLRNQLRQDLDLELPEEAQD